MHQIPYIFIFNVTVVLNSCTDPCACLLGQMEGAIFSKNTSSSSQTHLRPWRQLTGETSREVSPRFIHQFSTQIWTQAGHPKTWYYVFNSLFFCLNRSPLCPHQEASLSNTAHSLSDLSSRLSYSERWEMSRRTEQLPNTSRSMVPVSQTSQAAKARAVLPTQRLSVTVEKRGAANIWEQPSQLFTGYHPCWVRKHWRFFQLKGNNRHRQRRGPRLRLPKTLQGGGLNTNTESIPSVN